MQRKIKLNPPPQFPAKNTRSLASDLSHNLIPLNERGKVMMDGNITQKILITTQETIKSIIHAI